MTPRFIDLESQFILVPRRLTIDIICTRLTRTLNKLMKFVDVKALDIALAISNSCEPLYEESPLRKDFAILRTNLNNKRRTSNQILKTRLAPYLEHNSPVFKSFHVLDKFEL